MEWGSGGPSFARRRTPWLEDGIGSMMLWVLKDNPTRGFYEHLGGVEDREQSTEIGSASYFEIAYGWPDLLRWLHDSGAIGVDSSGT